MKKFLFFLLISTTIFAAVVEDQSNLSVETPSLKERSMRKLRLENGLEALLISDPQTPSSGAALAISVGSWNDPENRPGMAHFVEHLLFLGTEKYPEEEGYTRYLDEHGGLRNAFTMSDRTCYIFSVNNEGFSEALDRFAQFFIAPLFSPSGVERERIAIHQEYCKDIPLDAWRSLYVKKEIANVKHPFHAFCIGNLETLAKIEQGEVKEWYKKHYSADRMHLVVYSKDPLDQLEKEVTTLFSSVNSNDYTLPICQEPLFSEMCLTSICPVREILQLDLIWEIPSHFIEDRERHVCKMVSHVLGHEGETSLLAQLKREHLADEIGVGLHKAGQNQGFLTISLGLTEEGIEQYETVIERTYQALAHLKQTRFPRYLFDEVVQLEELQYRYQSREEIFEFVSDYAVAMIDEPLETFPRKTLIPSRFDQEAILNLVNQLKPEQALINLIAPEKLNPFKPDRKERWLGAPYSVRAIPKERISKWQSLSCHPAISLPAPNKFLPENLHVYGQESGQKDLPKPRLLADTLQAKVYGCRDDHFLVPEISWHFTFKTPKIEERDPKSQALANLYCYAVNQKLTPSLYSASMAGLDYALKPSKKGIELSIEGFNDKASVFLSTILNFMQNSLPTKEEFHLYKNLLKREYCNLANASVLKQGSEILKKVIYAEYSSFNEKCQALSSIHYNDFVKFSKQLWDRAYCESTLFGNQSDEDEQAVISLLHKMRANAYPPHLHPKVRTATFSQAAYLVEKSELSSNAVILTMDLGDFTFEKRAAQEILSKGLEEPFFSELRTKQQTAYLVSNWSTEIERHLYSCFAIQSSTHETRDLLARFELFLENGLQRMKLETIPPKRFEAIRTSLIEKLEKPAENLMKMGAILHMLAFEYDADFSWLEKRKEALSKLTYAQFLDYVHAFLGKENRGRLAICVDGELPENQKFQYTPISTFETFRKQLQYKGR